MNSLFPHLPAVRARMSDADITALAIKAECYETDRWAAEAILRHEILTPAVWDPCCGTGVLSDVARKAGYRVVATDLYDWEYDDADLTGPGGDFLARTEPTFHGGDFTIFMNPPFSLACQFVDQAFELGARKIVCLQRFAWWESLKRREWWEARPPHRVYICGQRASCWRFDIPLEKRTSSTTTAHAWFVWQPGHPPGTTLGHVWRDG